MGRKKGPDKNKIKLIKEVLRKNPQGLWIREIARKAGLDKSTVSIYISTYMKDEVENLLPDAVGNLIKVVRLKRK